MMKAWVNGRIVDEADVTVSALSHSVGRGSAIFEVLDVVAARGGPAVFRLGEHVERLFASAAAYGMPLPVDREALARGVLQAVAACELPRGAVKTLAYYTAPEFGLIPRDRTVEVAVFCTDLASLIGTDDPRQLGPISVGIPSIRKLAPNSVAVKAKAAGNYVNAYLARTEAQSRGYDDALMRDQAGLVIEGTISNVFFVRGETVLSPRPGGALSGITRDSVVRIIRDLNIPLAEADLTPDEARAADEAFLTGTLIRVRPIRSIDGQALGSGCPGPVTTRIREAFHDAYEGLDERYADWLTPVG